MRIPLQYIWSTKEILTWISWFRLLTKIKLMSRTSFYQCNILSVNEVIIPDLNPLSVFDHFNEKQNLNYLHRYRTICVFKILFRYIMTLRTSKFFFNQLFLQWLTREERGESEIKIWISRDHNEFLRWNIKYFSHFFQDFLFVNLRK